MVMKGGLGIFALLKLIILLLCLIVKVIDFFSVVSCLVCVTLHCLLMCLKLNRRLKYMSVEICLMSLAVDI